ncbi:triacylglycerol lipase [Antrihabitans cavernicola]|uniref:Triacylglycerol lipase n=2 Tax=Antrihabitans cavernicola TaxID=2495913 RepID=A0A5A7S7X4_9NOCA|nr:triacylglycerol lipase [Spelaeibacter cavernicola]
MFSLLVAVLMPLAMIVVGGSTASAEPPPPPDSFYDVPAGLAAAKPGAVLKSRPVDVKLLQLLPINVTAWQLLYRTTAADGSPYAAVTTVMIPRGPAKPRPLLSYQAATDSISRICGPSYSLTNGLPIELGNPAGPLTFALPGGEVALAAAGLEQGWAVALPDHGGINDRFLTPREPGYAVLDGIRAVEGFQPVGLTGASTPVGMWGYSGGAIASSWAVELQPTYAPELNIKGAAFGAPERDLEASLRAANATPLAGLIPIALSAIGKDVPGFTQEVNKFATPDGAARMAETANHCLGQNVLANLWFDYRTLLNQPIDVVLKDPILRKAIDDRGMTNNIPTAPLYVYNGVTEEVAPIVATDRQVNGYCAGGTPVTYRRQEFPPRPFPQVMSTHGVVAITGAPDAFAWLKQRLAPNAPRPSGCDIQTVPTTLLTPDSLSVLGPSFIGNMLLTALGQPIGAGR